MKSSKKKQDLELLERENEMLMKELKSMKNDKENVVGSENESVNDSMNDEFPYQSELIKRNKELLKQVCELNTTIDELREIILVEKSIEKNDNIQTDKTKSSFPTSLPQQFIDEKNQIIHENNALKKEIESLSSHVKELQCVDSSLKKTRLIEFNSTANERLSEFENIIISKTDELRDREKHINELSSKFDSVRESSIVNENQKQTLQTENDILKKQLKEFEKNEGESDILRNSLVDLQNSFELVSVEKSCAMDRISILEKVIQENREKENELLTKILNDKEKVRNVDEATKKLHTEIGKLTFSLKFAEDTCEQKKEEVEKLKELNQKTIEEYELKINEIKGQNDTLENQNNELSKSVECLENVINTTKMELEKVTEEFETYKVDSKNQIDAADEMKKKVDEIVCELKKLCIDCTPDDILISIQAIVKAHVDFEQHQAYLKDNEKLLKNQLEQQNKSIDELHIIIDMYQNKEITDVPTKQIIDYLQAENARLKEYNRIVPQTVIESGLGNEQLQREIEHLKQELEIERNEINSWKEKVKEILVGKRVVAQSDFDELNKNTSNEIAQLKNNLEKKDQEILEMRTSMKEEIDKVNEVKQQICHEKENIKTSYEQQLQKRLRKKMEETKQQLETEMNQNRKYQTELHKLHDEINKLGKEKTDLSHDKTALQKSINSLEKEKKRIKNIQQPLKTDAPPRKKQSFDETRLKEHIPDQKRYEKTPQPQIPKITSIQIPESMTSQPLETNNLFSMFGTDTHSGGNKPIENFSFGFGMPGLTPNPIPIPIETTKDDIPKPHSISKRTDDIPIPDPETNKKLIQTLIPKKDETKQTTTPTHQPKPLGLKEGQQVQRKREQPRPSKTPEELKSQTTKNTRSNLRFEGMFK
ncbi:Interaptin [Entamoeba marina]